MSTRTFLLICLLPLWLPARAAIYGPGIQADSLANTPIGPYGNQVSYRFRADPGGRLRGIRPFIIWSFRKAGYHAGTGGNLKVEIQEDDGTPAHRPSGKVLAVNVQRLLLVPASADFYPFITFDRTPVLARGSLYHVVFSNIHPHKETNFVSVNALFARDAGAPLQPAQGDDGWAMLFHNTGHPEWVPRRTPGTREGFTPILEVSYAQGAQGLGYMEVWMGAAMPISGAARVGEVFTVSGGPRRVASVAVRVRRLAGSEPLRLTLEEVMGGGSGKPPATLVRQVCAGSAGQGPLPAISAPGSLGGCAWTTFPLPGPVQLLPGRTYRLVLAAPASARYEAFPLRKGSDKGFTGAALFTDGHAQFDPGTGWRGWTQWGRQDRPDADLQFYFRLAPSEGEPGPQSGLIPGPDRGEREIHRPAGAQAQGAVAQQHQPGGTDADRRAGHQV